MSSKEDHPAFYGCGTVFPPVLLVTRTGTGLTVSAISCIAAVLTALAIWRTVHLNGRNAQGSGQMRSQLQQLMVRKTASSNMLEAVFGIHCFYCNRSV